MKFTRVCLLIFTLNAIRKRLPYFVSFLLSSFSFYYSLVFIFCFSFFSVLCFFRPSIYVFSLLFVHSVCFFISLSLFQLVQVSRNFVSMDNIKRDIIN